MGNDWLTDELMQRAAKLIQDIDGIASQGTVYVVSRALYEAEKRGREEAAKIADDWSDIGGGFQDKTVSAVAAAIRSGQ